jgi:P27 family predicted phage terminase small subunit
MRGRKPTPAQLKLVQGNPGRRPVRNDEPKPAPATNPAPPAHLSDEAREHWQQVAAELSAARVLTKLDVDALAMYCESYARWAWANAQIRKHGVLVKTPSGYPTQSPLLQIANKAFEHMRAMLTEFGMTPSSRARVTAVGRDDEGHSGWDAL